MVHELFPPDQSENRVAQITAQMTTARRSPPFLLRTVLLAAFVLPFPAISAPDSFQTDLSNARPGSVVRVSGSHTGEFVTKVNGTAEAPIMIEGDGTAVLIGASPTDPVLRIKHSWYRVKNI